MRQLALDYASWSGTPPPASPRPTARHWSARRDWRPPDDARSRAAIQANLLDATLGDTVASEDNTCFELPTLTAHSGVPLTGGARDRPAVSSSAIGQLYPGVTVPPAGPNMQTGEVDVYRPRYLRFQMLPIW